jgi:hypothetical protein
VSGRQQNTFVLSPPLVQKLLGEVIYQDLVELVDLQGVYNLQQMLAMNIEVLGDIDHERATELAKSMIDDAWKQLDDHPARTGVPFDCDDCELCALAEAEQAKARTKGSGDAKH